MASSTISRRAFLKLSSRHPNRLILKPKQSNPRSAPKDESQWPKSLQMVGYAAVVVSIPYSISVIVAESAHVRSTIEDNGGNFGRSIIKWVRWYWGHQEEVPYFESIMEIKTNDNTGSTSEDRLQLRGEDSPVVRSTQAEIKKTTENNITFRLTSDGGLESTARMPGGTLLSDSKIFGEDMSKRLIISFDEHEENEEESMVEDGLLSHLGGSTSDYQRNSGVDLTRLTTIWSSWNHFPSDFLASTTSSVSGTSAADSTEIKIDELTYNISELQKLLRDPLCTRDRDDMEVELQEIRIELRRLKRMRRIGKLRNIWS